MNLEPISHTISKPYNDPRIHHEIEKSCSQHVFKCPTCEQNISLPVGGTSVLPHNLHLRSELEVAGYMSKIVSNSEVCCDQCIEGISGPAVMFCCTCCQFLCQLCHDHHKRHRQLSKHNMVGLDQEGAKQLLTTMKPGGQLCSLHNCQLDVYCETCKHVSCPQCIHDSHKDHRSVPLSSVAKSLRDEMEDLMSTRKVVVTKLTGAVDRNLKMIEQVDISKRNVTFAINQAFDILQKTLEERKKTLLSEVEAISLSKITALTLQKEQFEKIVEDIDHYTEMTSHILQTHTVHEVVALGGLIPTELQATLKRFQSMSLTPNQHSHISVSAQTDDLVKKLSKFGHVSEFDPSSSTWTSTSVAKVGTRFHVKVEIKTSEGEGYPHHDVQVKGTMRSMVHSGSVVYGEVEDHGGGVYTITLTPHTAGPHQLVIKMDGQHVQNSPHDLDVRPKHDYLTLSTKNAQKLIECNDPLCVAIHGNGDIYVGSEDNCICVFDQTGQLKNTIGSGGNDYDDGQFNTPCGIFIKGDMLYVADNKNHRVQKLTSRGKFLHKFGQGQLYFPTAVIVDANSRLIVADNENKRIRMFSESGGLLRTIDDTRSMGRFKRVLALDPQGNIHFTTYDSQKFQNTIKVVTKEGLIVRTYGDGDLKDPGGIAINGEGYSLVTDFRRLSIFDPQGNKIHTVQYLNNLKGIALDPNGDGSVYVTNCSSVLKYSI